MYALLVIVIWLLLCALVAWPVMLLIGALHAASPAIPAIGFWLTYAIVLVIKLFF